LFALFFLRSFFIGFQKILIPLIFTSAKNRRKFSPDFYLQADCSNSASVGITAAVAAAAVTAQDPCASRDSRVLSFKSAGLNAGPGLKKS